MTTEEAHAQATALSASPWVSVKERMPTAEDGDECCEVLYRSVRGEAFVRSWSYAAVAPGATHWMPIPPLPQQEG